MMITASLRPAARLFTTVVESEVRHTALYDYHIAQYGKMVEFAGWSLPLIYKDQTHAQSHIHTRTKASLFDVSHMLQTQITGVESLEKLVVGDIRNLGVGQGTLSLFTTNTGGIMDDCVIQRLGKDDRFYAVNNAGCATKIINHLNTYPDVQVKYMHDHALIALQGPLAVKILAETANNPSITTLPFMHGTPLLVKGIRTHVTRCGYTGEDGVEISVHNNDVLQLTDMLVLNPNVKLAGLAARDSLRLEAGLCLYGHDIDESVSPVEAGLAWTIGKDRRTGARAKFLGSGPILSQLHTKMQDLNHQQKRRVGLIIAGAPAREGAQIVHLESGLELGTITSGCPSPVLKQNIAMGYVINGMHKLDTQLGVLVRGKVQVATVVKMPFVPHKYYRS